VRRDYAPYELWKKTGKVMVSEGKCHALRGIRNFCPTFEDKFDIKEITYDRWNAAQIVQRLVKMGITMVPFVQGFASMSSPTKELMKLVLEQRLAHGGNEPLAWMADNVTVRTDAAGNVKSDKEKSAEKIDGIVVLIMALDRALKQSGGGSPYDTRGIIVRSPPKKTQQTTSKGRLFVVQYA
jgi:phage terminase large subunit-like protein